MKRLTPTSLFAGALLALAALGAHALGEERTVERHRDARFYWRPDGGPLTRGR